MDKPASEKSDGAYRTISEVAADLDLPQHVLRFWETRFPQVRPLKRAGGRRFYRPADVALLRDIRARLYDEGYTIKGVQRLLRERNERGDKGPRADESPASLAGPVHGDGATGPAEAAGVDLVKPAEAGSIDLAEAEAAAAGPADRSAAPLGGAPGAGLAALREALALVEACEHRLRAAISPGG